MQNRERWRADTRSTMKQERLGGVNIECLHPLATARGSASFALHLKPPMSMSICPHSLASPSSGKLCARTRHAR